MKPIGYIFKGAEIEVEDQFVAGMNVNGNNRWYRDAGKSWYYWSGKTEVVMKPVKPDSPSVVTGPPGGYPVFPVFGSITSMADSKDIPKGETRIVPPFETLEMIEEGFQNAMMELQNAVSVTALAKEQINVGGTPPLTSTSSPTAKVSSPIGPFVELEIEEGGEKEQQTSPPKQGSFADRTIDRSKLSWGIKKYNLWQDWWKHYRITGKDVKVALLSTGVPSGHPDLANIANTYFYGDTSQLDAHGLGAQTAVICAGTGQHLYGVAPEAELLIGKVGEQDYTIRPEALIAGVEWAIEENADILAMLVDFPILKAAEINRLEKLIKQAKAKDIFLLAPVGNSNNKKPESRYPARFEGVFSVGAHTELGERCNFSAKSYDLDLLAPGEGLLTSGVDGEIMKNSRSVAVATAFTAGFAALLHQWLQQLMHADKAAAIEKILKDTAAKRQNINVAKNVDHGYGLLNPMAVLKQLNSLA